jgi:hypothetical protein
MGRTIPTANRYIGATVHDLKVIRDALFTRDKKLLDEFMSTAHLNERAVSMAVFYEPFDAMVLAMLFRQFKMIRRLGGKVGEWNTTLDAETSGPEHSESEPSDGIKP